MKSYACLRMRFCFFNHLDSSARIKNMNHETKIAASAIAISISLGPIFHMLLICSGARTSHTSILGILTYVVLRNRPGIALGVVTIAELIGFMPTWRKTRNAPFSESLSSYYFLVVKLLLILIALESYDFLTVANSVCWLVVMLSFIGTTLFQRYRQSQPLL